MEQFACASGGGCGAQSLCANCVGSTKLCVVTGDAREETTPATSMVVDAFTNGEAKVVRPPSWEDSPARHKRRTGEEDFATRSDLREMLEGFKAELSVANAQSAERSIGNLLRKYDVKVQERMDKLEHDHLELEDRVSKMEAKLRAQEAHLQKTDKEIATFSAADPVKAVRDDAWDRAPDFTVLKLNANSMVAKSQVQSVIADWLSEAGCDGDKAKLEGPALGKAFSLQFGGDTVLAARRAKKAHASLRGSDGSWKEHKVRAPSGEEVDLYVGIDKSPKQQQTESCGKRLLKHLQAKHPEEEFGLVPSRVASGW